jgi:hypothetical protein
MSDGQDEIWVRVGGSWFPSYLSSTTFTEGQTRTHDELSQPKATKAGDFVKIEIHEDDPWPQANDFLGEETSAAPTAAPGRVVTSPSSAAPASATSSATSRSRSSSDRDACQFEVTALTWAGACWQARNDRSPRRVTGFR